MTNAPAAEICIKRKTITGLSLKGYIPKMNGGDRNITVSKDISFSEVI